MKHEYLSKGIYSLEDFKSKIERRASILGNNLYSKIPLNLDYGKYGNIMHCIDCIDTTIQELKVLKRELRDYAQEYAEGLESD